MPEPATFFLSDFPQLILIRSFSKTGLPGVGLGYFLTHHETGDQFVVTRVNSMIGSTQAAIAEQLFKCYTELESLCSSLVNEKNRVARRIAHETQHIPLPGCCDFLLIRTPDGDANILAQKLVSANLPALNYASLKGFENVIKLFPAAFSEADRLVATLSS